ncbi:hypothetical protein [Diaminobutyricimonas sp. LJ205]|uniref:hypothetical protein n=1 Tax=Diaminobutyricimonas sp. LJ205 TaxID=2683590 RepID=UPI0012F4F38F|nr:hypothetical protein [Diaminobutyricimonas sp. LJ205]
MTDTAAVDGTAARPVRNTPLAWIAAVIAIIGFVLVASSFVKEEVTLTFVDSWLDIRTSVGFVVAILMLVLSILELKKAKRANCRAPIAAVACTFAVLALVPALFMLLLVGLIILGPLLFVIAGS